VFIEQGSGRFFQVTSIGGRGTAPATSAYQNAKFAAEGFSWVLNDEVKFAPLFDHLRERRGTEPIDPDKVARVLLDVAQLDEPPLHLVLGTDAVERVKAGMARQVAEDERWADVRRSVDFD
jgi:hypothetical protein